MAERDPRVNPLPGDVLEFGKHRLQVTVTGVAVDGVSYTVPTRKEPLQCKTRSMKDWLVCFASATVIRRAEDGTTGRDGR